MARRPRSSVLEARARRLALPIQKKPQAPFSVTAGVTLLYRRCKGPGRWVVKVADGRGGNWEKTIPGVADDHEDSNGDTVLNFWEAIDKARALARGGRGGRPETLAEALNSYEQDLTARGGDTANASRLKFNLPAPLLGKPVAMLTSRDVRGWRDNLSRAGMKGPTLLRTIKVMRAVLNLAARSDRRIQNRDAWRDGLRPADIANSFNVRNVILSDVEVTRLVTAAYAISEPFGLYVEVHAVTGARSSQIAALDIADLQADRLMMLPSQKGKKKDRTKKPTPIPAPLAARLRKAAAARPSTAPLLIRADGERWRPENGDHQWPFARAAKRAELDGVTAYALRHSCAVRQIKAGVPLRIVATLLDTSTAMLERVYSAYIADHADEIARKGLLALDLKPSASDSNNVVALPPKRRS